MEKRPEPVGNGCSHDTGRRVRYVYPCTGDDRTAGVANDSREGALPGLGMKASEKKHSHQNKDPKHATDIHADPRF